MDDVLLNNVEILSLNKKGLRNIFMDFLRESGYEILFEDNKYVKICDGKNSYNVYFEIKNISNSGWVEKPFIKRIQTKPLDNIIPTKDDTCFLLLGIIKYGDRYLLVSWNAFRYVNHKTCRSAYVNVYALDRAYHEGFFHCNDFNDNINICDSKHFNELLTSYIDYTILEDCL